MSTKVHSVAEAYLWLMLQRCEACARGPVIPHSNPPPQVATGDSTWRVGEAIHMATRCGACGAAGQAVFDVGGAVSWPRLHGQIPVDQPINATDEPSEAIDVAGWLTLASVIAEAARVETADRGLARALNVQVGRCLEEALKFYAEGEELPEEEAFFDDAARRQFRDRPELFARTRLIDWRGKLPVTKA